MTSPSAPKRRNAGATRTRILEAARQCFVEQGYAGATIRDIASRADINSSLVGRYFGSKAGLFKAALSSSIQIDRLIGVDRRTFGRIVAANFLDDDAQLFNPAMSLTSAKEEVPKQIISDVQQQHVIPPLAAWLGPPDAHQRAMRIIILCAGFLIYVNQLHGGKSPPTLDDPTVIWFIECIQQIVDQSGEPNMIMASATPSERL